MLNLGTTQKILIRPFVKKSSRRQGLISKSKKAGALRGGERPLERVAEDSPWTLSLCSRVTEGRGCSQGEASPFYRRKNGSSSLQTKDERKNGGSRSIIATIYRLSSIVFCLIPIFSTQKFLTRILLWQRLLFSVTVTWAAVWNAP